MNVKDSLKSSQKVKRSSRPGTISSRVSGKTNDKTGKNPSPSDQIKERIDLENALQGGSEEVKDSERDITTDLSFLEDVIEAIPSLFYVIDENGTLIKWNKNVEVVTGYSPEELKGANVLDYFILSSDRQYIKDGISKVFRKGKSTAYARYKIKDGTSSPYFFTGVRTRIRGKYYQIGVAVDCTEIENAREAMREINERLALAVESSDAGLWVLDLKTNSLWLTQKSIDLHEVISEDTMSVDSFLETVDPGNREAVQDAVRRAVSTGEDLKTECRILLPGGGFRWLDVRGRLHKSPSGEPERLMGLSMDITERKLMEEQLKERMIEIMRLKKQLEKENVYLREEVKNLFERKELIGESKVFKDVLLRAEQVAPTDTTVLILGETGTGKEVLARAIHDMSRRSGRPLVTVNCASLPPSLIESELFGREKGAYTGALTKMTGRFEVANESTLFLDEVGELPMESQGKLLRAIEQGCFERLGSTKSIQVNVRIIAATNRDLVQAVREGKFRSDLYYRLNVFPVKIPPLRERRDDIKALVWAFIEQLEKKLGKRIESIPKKTMDALESYSWPGNVRELRNVVEHAMIISNKELNAYLPVSGPEAIEGNDLKEMERRHIRSVLEMTGWRVSGKKGAAEILGLKRTTLIYKMKVLGITNDGS